MIEYVYRPEVLAALERHGIRPTRHTPPDVARGYLRELYKYELRLLRERYLKKEFPKPEYHVRVAALRDQYPVLALTARLWVMEPR